MTITAIIPLYNNVDSIETKMLISRKYAKHIIVINDGSKDRTVKVAQLAVTKIKHDIKYRAKNDSKNFFMAFSGIILHTMARVINENRIVKKVSKGGMA